MPKWSRVACIMAAATLVCSLAASCGDNDTGSRPDAVTTVPVEASTTPTNVAIASSTSSSEVATPDESSGWGVDGSGFSVVRVRTNDETSIDTRVFRRSRTEKSGERIVLNNRDVFVATRVARIKDGTTTVTIHVDGFETEGDDPARYPMSDFGEEGRVSVEVSAKEPEWLDSPVAWTVVSRELLVVLFDRSSVANASAGMVEYYDLNTGALKTALGSGGRTVIPPEFGIDDVQDVALRSVDADGTPRLVVSGLTFDDRGSVSDVVVAGFTPDAVPDPQVGDDASGRISLIGSLPDRATHAWWDARLADPGLGTPTGAVGVLVSASVVDPEGSSNLVTPTDTSMTAIVARRSRTGGVVSLEPANGSFANTMTTGLSFVAVRNVVLDADRLLNAHVSGAVVGGFVDSSTGPINRLLTFSNSSTPTGIVSKDVSSPFRLPSSRKAASVERLVLDVSNSGKQFAVETFRNTGDGSSATYLCFGDRPCYGNEDLPPRPLTDTSSRAGGQVFVHSMSVGPTGISVLVNEMFDDQTKGRYTFASLTVNGKSPSQTPTSFDADFATSERAGQASNAGEPDTNPRTVLEPRILDSGRLVAVGSNQPDDEINFLHLQEPDGPAKDVSLSLPLGVRSYSARENAFASLGDRSGILSAQLWSDTGAEDRLYKVDVENGSVDVNFGVSGHVVVPHITVDGDGCRWERRTVTGADVVAVLNVDTDLRSVDDDTRCADVPAELTWSAFDAAGRPIDGSFDVSVAKLDGLPFTEITGYAVDPRGSVYVAGFADRFDEQTRWVGSDTFVAKYARSGILDPEFGDGGVVALSATKNPLFASGSESSIAVDAEGRVYIAAPVIDGAGNTDVWIARLKADGAIDATTGASSPTTVAPDGEGSQTPLTKIRQLGVAVERRLLLAADRAAADARDARLAPGNGLTVVTTEPILTALRAVEDRALAVWWSTSHGRSRDYVTATLNPGGRRCASTSGSCVIRGLDPSIAYTATVVRKGSQTEQAQSTEVPPTKPVVVLRVGRVASPTTYVRPATRGAAVWRVDGGCRLNDTNTRLNAPNSPATCRLSVTTEKFGSTPKTTKSVTIVVQK